jgi:hypothetical protein
VIFAGVGTAVELLTALLWSTGNDAPHAGGVRQFEGQLNNAASARDRQPKREWTDTDGAAGLEAAREDSGSSPFHRSSECVAKLGDVDVVEAKPKHRQNVTLTGIVVLAGEVCDLFELITGRW